MSDDPHENRLAVLAHWFVPADLRQLKVKPIAGGLSGAKLWQVNNHEQSYCLRRWPLSCALDVDQVKTIHGLIEHVWSHGLPCIPVPRRTLSGQTVAEAEGQLCELSAWLEGEVTAQPTNPQWQAATAALAKFHLAAASFRDTYASLAPGLQKRVNILESLHSGGMSALKLAVGGSPPSKEREMALSLLEDLAALLAEALCDIRGRASVALPMQWCVGDAHIGNFLFGGNEVTGLVDFGAAGVDCVVADLSRLITSFAGNDRAAWYDALKTYEQRRPLSCDERRALSAYVIGGWIGASANWLRWRFVEGRPFADAAITQSRLSHLSARIKAVRAGTGVFAEHLFKNTRPR